MTNDNSVLIDRLDPMADSTLSRLDRAIERARRAAERATDESLKLARPAAEHVVGEAR